MSDAPIIQNQSEGGNKEGISAISAIAYGFLGSQALFSALKLGLFTNLTRQPATLEELSISLAIPAGPLQVLLSSCVGLKLLGWDGERYQNSAAAQRYLVKTMPGYIGDYYLRQIQLTMYESANQIHSILQGEAQLKPTYASFLSAPATAEEFIRGQHAGSGSPAYLLARNLDFSGFSTLLDLGGGSGAFSIEAVRRYPQLKARVLDHPPVVAIAEKIIQEANLSDRIECIPGNLLTTSWPDGADLILLSYIVSCYQPETLDDLLARAYAYLPDGGQLIIHDFAFYPDRSGPHNTALLLYGQLAISAQTRAYTTTEIAQALEKAGFIRIATQPLLPDLTFLITGVKSTHPV